MKAKFLSYKKIKSKKDAKTYHILEASDGIRSKEFFVNLSDEQLEALSNMSEGDGIEIEFDANPFASDRISIKSVLEA